MLIPSTIVYTGDPFTLTNGVQMSADTPTAAGGAVESWSISPDLPTGLAFDTATGEISGTPTVLSPLTTYTITATNTGGTDTASVTIVVNDVVPTITYSSTSLTLTRNTPMTTLTPTTSGGTITSWSVSPSLPAGLSLDSSTGAISGTPSAVTSSANYTITATNTGGSDTATITIVVNDIARISRTAQARSP